MVTWNGYWGFWLLIDVFPRTKLHWKNAMRILVMEWDRQNTCRCAHIHNMPHTHIHTHTITASTSDWSVGISSSARISFQGGAVIDSSLCSQSLRQYLEYIWHNQDKKWSCKGCLPLRFCCLIQSHAASKIVSGTNQKLQFLSPLWTIPSERLWLHSMESYLLPRQKKVEPDDTWGTF